VLSVAGDLDLAAVPQLRQEVQARLANGTQSLTLDLGGITFLDSSGLGVLVELRNLAGGQGVGLDIVNVPAGPARIITIAGLADTFGLPSADNDGGG
jgi:anti-sigma B factor antagonist